MEGKARIPGGLGWSRAERRKSKRKYTIQEGELPPEGRQNRVIQSCPQKVGEIE